MSWIILSLMAPIGNMPFRVNFCAWLQLRRSVILASNTWKQKVMMAIKDSGRETKIVLLDSYSVFEVDSAHNHIWIASAAQCYSYCEKTFLLVFENCWASSVCGDLWLFVLVVLQRSFCSWEWILITFIVKQWPYNFVHTF